MQRDWVGTGIIVILHEYYVLFFQGEFPYIDPKTYTDEELGIPPDSAGSLKQ